jgi:hypothetical protein
MPAAPTDFLTVGASSFPEVVVGSADFRPCETCGQSHVARTARGILVPACVGHIRSGVRRGEPCRQHPRKGLSVCDKHGVNGRALAAAERRAQTVKAEHLLRRFGGPIDTTPTEALLDTVKWTAGYVAWLREKVADVRTDQQLVWGMTRAKLGGEDNGVTHAAGPNAWLVLLADWQDRLVRVCAESIKAGIAERQVRIAEAQGQLLADVIRAVLRDLRLSPEQESLVAEVVPRHLRAVAG